MIAPSSSNPWNAQTSVANSHSNQGDRKCTRAKALNLLPFLFLPDAYGSCGLACPSENALGYIFSRTKCVGLAGVQDPLSKYWR